MKRMVWAAVTVLMHSMAIAGTTGSVKGRIVDETMRQPLPGATVSIVTTTMGVSTDSAGAFTIGNVPEGLYELEVRYVGYKALRKPDVRVVRNKTTLVPDLLLTMVPIEADTMTVTAGLFQDNGDMPVSTMSLTKDEIRRTPGAAGDVFRALGSLPGVATEGGSLSEFSVRGGGPKDNLILIDNIPFTKVSHFDDGAIEGEEAQGGRFSVFAPTLIERAEFNAGGFPARYGGKNSSAIVMDLRDGNPHDVTVYGHYDLLGWEANYDGPVPLFTGSGLLVSARHTDFTTVLKMIGESGNGNGSYSDLLLKSSVPISPTHTLSVLGIYSEDLYTRTLDNVYDGDNLNSNALARHKDYRWLAGATDRLLLGDKGMLQTTGYYFKNGVNGREGMATTAATGGVLLPKEGCAVRENITDQTVRERTFGFKSDLTLALGRDLTMLAGVEGRRTTYTYTLALDGEDTVYVYDRRDPGRDPSKEFVVLSPSTADENNAFSTEYAAGYAEWSIKVTPQWTVNPGIRYEYYSYNHEGIAEPRLSMRYQLHPGLAVNVAAGMYAQMPELSILDSDPANARLTTEKAAHLVAGVSSYLTSNMRLSVETYYKRYTDLPVRTNSYVMRYTSAGTGWAGGCDISLVRRLSEKWYGQASYSYTVSRRDDHDGAGEYDYRFSKPHMLTILGGLQLSDVWSVTAKYLVTSGLPTDEYVIHRDVLHDPAKPRSSAEIVARNGRRFPVNQSFDVRVDYRTQFSFLAVSAYLDIWNLFGTMNRASEEFLPQSGEFTSEVFGMIPTLGFNLEF